MMIWLIVGLVVGGAVGFIVASQLTSNATVYWHREAKRLKRAIDLLSGNYND